MGRTWQEDCDEQYREHVDRWLHSIIPILLGLMIMLNLPPENTGWFALVAGAGICVGVGMCLRLLYGTRQ